MKKTVWLLVFCMLLTACARHTPPGAAVLREGMSPEQLVEELSGQYDMSESMRLESAADLAALLGIREKCLLQGCGRIAAPEDNPQQILLGKAAPGKMIILKEAMQRRLETVRQAFAGYPSAQMGRVIAIGDYVFLVVVTTEDMDSVERQIREYFSVEENG